MKKIAGIIGLFMALLGGTGFAVEIAYESVIFGELSSTFSNLGCSYNDSGIRCGFLGAIFLVIALIAGNIFFLIMLVVGLIEVNDAFALSKSAGKRA